MDIRTIELEKLEHMAGIQLSTEEVERFKKDLCNLTDWVNKLQEVDTQGIEPIVHMSFELNKLHEDIPEPAMKLQDALKNAPQQDGAYFYMPSAKQKEE